MKVFSPLRYISAKGENYLLEEMNSVVATSVTPRLALLISMLFVYVSAQEADKGLLFGTTLLLLAIFVLSIKTRICIS